MSVYLLNFILKIESVPRPGYTSGLLSSRPVSLPRGVNGNAATAPSGWNSALSPSQRKIYATNASRTLPVNGGTGAPLDVSRDGAFSCKFALSNTLHIYFWNRSMYH